MKFKYSFHSILKYKEQLEETEKVKYAELNNEKKIEVEKLEDIKLKLVKKRETVGLSKIKNITEHRLNDSILINLEDSIVSQNKIIEKKEKKCEEQRKKLELSQRERKMFDSLKEKEYKKHNEELKKLEGKEMNEIAIQRYYLASLEQ